MSRRRRVGRRRPPGPPAPRDRRSWRSSPRARERLAVFAAKPLLRAKPASRHAVGDTASKLRISLSEMFDGARDDVIAGDLREAARDVVDEALLCVVRLEPIEIASLLEVVDL